MAKKTTKTSKKKSSAYKIFLAVLITTLVYSFIALIIFGWNAFELSSHRVYYTSSQTDIIGIFPKNIKFRPGEEVVVRAGSISKKNTEFIGWKDVDNVIKGSGGILENGDVFIMPNADVHLETVWADENTKTQKLVDSYAVEKSSKKDENAKIFQIKGTDYVNLRSSSNYDGDVITKISDPDTKIEYYGEHEEIYDEDDETTYTWYYVEVPSLGKGGWIRSDLLSEYKSESKKESQKEKEKIYLMSSKYDSINMYKEADSSSKKVETIEDNEISLIFLDDTKKTTDDDGDTTTWYYIENSETGKKGWIEKNKLQYIETE